MILELYGLPGSGKSTLARKLVASSDKFIIINFINRWERYYFFILFIINHPILFSSWILFLFKNKKLFFYKFHLLSISMAKTQKALRYKKNDKNYIIDEGLVQRILSVSDVVINDSLFNKLLVYLSCVDRFVFVEGGDFYRFTQDSQKFNSPRMKFGQDYFQSWQKLLIDNNRILNHFLFFNTTYAMKIFLYKPDLDEVKKFIVQILV